MEIETYTDIAEKNKNHDCKDYIFLDRKEKMNYGRHIISKRN